MLPKLTFVLGGAASGKSAFAEKLVTDTGAARVYLATSEIYDTEMRAKIDAHIAMRGPDWETVEAPLDVASVLRDLPADKVLLLDCATMWLSNHMHHQSDLPQAFDALIAALLACKGRVIVVSNEVGMGIVPDNALARAFRNEQGRLNQRLAAAADLAVFVVAGIPQVLKGTLP